MTTIIGATTNYHNSLTQEDSGSLIPINQRFANLDAAIASVASVAAGLLNVVAGQGIAENDAVYISRDDGKAYLLDNDALTPNIAFIRGFATQTVISGGNINVQIADLLDGFSGLSPLQPVYVGSVAGTITQARPVPAKSGGQIAIVQLGIAWSATQVLIRPMPVQYHLRDEMSEDDELSIVHHYDDASAPLRQIWAYITETATGVTAQSYASANQDSDMPLRNGVAIRDKITSWWDLDEVAGGRADASGSNNLTDNNTVTFTTGKKGNAADFTRANSEYLSVADNSTLDAGDIDLTLGCWVKLDSKPASMGIMGKWDGDTEYILYYNTSSDRLQFIVNDGSGNTLVNADTLGSPSTGTWYFIMAWHDEANDTINIQVNNGGVDSEAHSTGIKVGTGTFTLGRFSASNYFDGQIDSPFLAKDLFTSDEKTWLYNDGAGRSYHETVNRDKLSQTFTLASETDIASVGLWLKKVGSPTGTATVRIETVSSGDPTGTLADAEASITFAESTLGTSYAEKLLTFTSEFTLPAGTYAIVLSTNRTASSINYIEWGADGSSPSYASGEMLSEQDSSWEAESKDAVFSIYQPGVVNVGRISVDWWSSSHADIVNRYGDGAGIDGDTKTTFKCTRVAGFDDVTLVVEVA